MRGPRAAATLALGLVLALSACAHGDPWAAIVARTPTATLLERSEPLPGRQVVLYSVNDGACARVVLAQWKGRRIVEDEVLRACDASIQAGLSIADGPSKRRPDLMLYTAVSTERCEAPSDPAPGVHDFGECELGVSHGVLRWRLDAGGRRWSRVSKGR
ncbi:MAG: hypothetical protein H6710_21760 [Myxococcales bacterium]|nr:hypothetical protein [Myxococcales bacterium]MCB9706404.1 hypothetical protein [Myxococcales bacterium]